MVISAVSSLSYLCGSRQCEHGDRVGHRGRGQGARTVWVSLVVLARFLFYEPFCDSQVKDALTQMLPSTRSWS